MTDQSFAEQVFKEIDYFFSIGGSNDNDLLRIACLGNPERTIQGALFLHLSKRFHVVLEIKLEGNSPDIAVFEDKNNIQPDVLIELKHRSPFQTGGFNSLIYTPPNSKGKRHDMFKDYFKHRSSNTAKEPTLILIGAATTIECVLSNSANFPFLKTKSYTPSNHEKLEELTTLRAGLIEIFKEWPSNEIENWYSNKSLPVQCIPPKPDKCFYRLNTSVSTDIKINETPASDLGNNIKGSVHAIGFMWLSKTKSDC